MQRTSGFSLAIRSTNSFFLFATPWMFHCMIFVLEMVLKIGQFLGNAWWSFPQGQHLTSVLVHLSLLCHWQLHFAHVAIVS